MEKIKSILNKIWTFLRPLFVKLLALDAEGTARQKLTTRIIRVFWIVITLPLIVISFGLLFASLGWFGDLPTVEDIEHPENNFATEVMSTDGKVLGKYYRENRTPVKFYELPNNLHKALVATEDERFYEHSGIDAYGLSRAVLKRLIGKNTGGASTITQQLAKMLFTGERDKSKLGRLQQKFKEWVISARLERQYTKQEIIAMYFNKFDFIRQAVGIKSASKIYFNKDNPKDLELHECAVLVGMAKNPSMYNPLSRPKRALNRRNTVFGQMLRNGLITEAEKDSLRALPLGLKYTRESHDTGLSTYFREFIRQELTTWCKQNKKPNGEPYNLYSDGLRIHTTIDSRLQAYAEKAVSKHNKELQKTFYKRMSYYKSAPWPWNYSKKKIKKNLEQSKKRTERYRVMKKAGASQKEIDKAFNTKTKMRLYTMKGMVDTVLTPMDSILHMKWFLHHSLMSMDPQTGFVKAWVGGINHSVFKYDNVHQGRRQVGSTFKPFVYATAIDQHNFSPCDMVPNAQVVFEKENWNLRKDWIPKNSDGKYGGEKSLADALANSTNTITAFLMKKVGPKKVIQLARKAGIESEIPSSPSICLGTPDISLFEMVGSYGAFANKGIYTKPIYITKIEDRNGTIIYQYAPETKAVLSEEKAYVMLKLMEGVSKYGSGARLRSKYKFYNPIAGKTGTTQSNKDGWFMGIVPNLVTGVWTGHEDQAIRFRKTKYGQGANMALPIWAEYMKMAYADKTLNISDKSFERPAQKMTIETNCKKKDQDQDNPSFGIDSPDLEF
ncbi:MAG: transglycosylase domain-containing protein [Flavobacteriales bacterium]|jgi:penicillin-binding protein 1A|nr:transglycosylase domain-containing protein [Flavobacteriales bacterium]